MPRPSKEDARKAIDALTMLRADLPAVDPASANGQRLASLQSFLERAEKALPSQKAIDDDAKRRAKPAAKKSAKKPAKKKAKA